MENEPSSENIQVSAVPIVSNFDDWSPLNDSIMGGSSRAHCLSNQKGLELYGDLIEEDGGFVSCLSPKFNPPLNLLSYRGLQLMVDGFGRTLKIAIYCKRENFKLNQMFFGYLHWVAQFSTDSLGTTTINIPFENFEPTIRAQPVSMKTNFDLSNITQIQLLHSKFGQPGELNPVFIPGQFKIILRSISGFF